MTGWTMSSSNAIIQPSASRPAEDGAEPAAPSTSPGASRAAVDDPAGVPNGPMPLTVGSCLEYAIYHRPLPFIRTLLEIGADPQLRTRIDDCETMREMALNAGFREIAELLAAQ